MTDDVRSTLNINNVYLFNKDNASPLAYYYKSDSGEYLFTMISTFDSLETENFTYIENTTESEGYGGNILTKLNKYVDTNASDNLLRWKFDDEKNIIVLDKN